MAQADVERVARIESGSFTSPWKADTFATLLDRPTTELWVIDDGGTVVGYAVLWCVMDQGELANIAVADSHRGRGLGARLLARVMDVARERGVESLYLEVRLSNIVAQNLYERFGFSEIGRRKDYYEKPREDALLLLARL